MGVIRLFLALVNEISQSPEQMWQQQPDKLAGAYGDFAYIGGRKTLRELILRQAEIIRRRAEQAPLQGLQAASKTEKKRYRRLKECRQATREEIAAIWFGRSWDRNSGLFPDFVLAWDSCDTLGNGAILELKDSESGNIASFNSTIPTRFKSLAELSAITKSHLVSEACWLRDFPYSLAPDYFQKPRACFYLVRTHRRSEKMVRLSLVEGSFFETLPKAELLRQVWRQILTETEMPEEQQEQVLPWLVRLEQAIIARSRHVTGASVKPRFRIMAEVESDANLHTYSEISPRTVNFVFKREEHHSVEWLRHEFAKEGFSVEVESAGQRTEFWLVERGWRLDCFSIWHRRNGEHWCLQWSLD